MISVAARSEDRVTRRNFVPKAAGPSRDALKVDSICAELALHRDQ